jgi:hypothetical protein
MVKQTGAFGRGLLEKDWCVLLLFGLVTFVLYFPVLGNGFITDDYASLYRILVEKRILYREMLRPLIDISFYFNYLYSGLHPVGYYVFNFCIHILTCYMVYKVALRLPFFEDRRQFCFALLAGMAFAVYPFHNEPIVWLSGRLSSMATLCALWALYLSLTKGAPWNFLLPALLLIIGLFAYESILPLPLIILVLREDLSRDRAKFGRAVGAWAVVGGICVLIRYVLAGTLLPHYYGPVGVINKEGNGILVRLLKAAGRCVLPPSEASGRMAVLFGVVAVVIVVFHFLLWKRRPGAFMKTYGRLGIAFILSMAAPVVFGISTRTSEGDRLLYFPSCFLCMLACVVVFGLMEKKWMRWSLVALFVAGSVYFIQENNQRWRVASATVEAILDTLKASPADRTILINAPDEWEGAFIFRNNFDRALLINRIRPSGVIVNNYLMRLDYLPVKGAIGVTGSVDGVTGTADSAAGGGGDGKDSLSIYPVTSIVRRGEFIEVGNVRTGARERVPLAGTRLYYWDKVRLKRVVLWDKGVSL